MVFNFELSVRSCKSRCVMALSFGFFLLCRHDVDGAATGPLDPQEIKLTNIKDVVKKWQVAMHEGNGWNSV